MSGWFALDNFPAPRWTYLGRGLFLAWFLAVTMASPLVLPAFTSQAALLAQRLALFALLLVTSACLLAAWRAVSPLRTHPARALACGALGTGGVLIYALVSAGVLPEAFMTVSFLVAVVALPFADAGWGEAYSYLPLRSAAAMTAASLLACAAALAMVMALPAVAAYVLLAALPPASCALLAVALSASPYRAYVEPASTASSHAVLEGMQPSWRFLLGVALLVCAAYLLNGASERVGTSAYVTGETVVLSVLGALGFLALLEVRPGHDPARFVVYLGLFESVALLVLALWGTPGTLGSLLTGLVFACATCVGIQSWLTVIDVAQTTKTSPFRACSLGLVAISEGKLAAEAASALDLAVGQLCSVGLALVVFGVFLLATNARPEEVELPAEVTLASRAAALAERCGLTPREHDVLVEWASGHNVQYVANKLGVTVNTAKTHIAHISQKTGTHGREELLRLLDETRPDRR